ncbi:hypothetical protein D3C84_1109390 [compost metagenome]
MHAFVGHQVVPGQQHHLAALEHLQVDLHRTQRQALGGAQGEVGPGVHHRTGACHLVRCIEAVEQHLPQTQLGVAEVQGFLVVIAEGAGSGVVGLFAAHTGYQVDGR